MPVLEEAVSRLSEIANLNLLPAALLSRYTRFGLGGPADIFVETRSESSFIRALQVIRRNHWPFVVIGGGTNLIVSDEGFRGIVLRLTACEITNANALVRVDAGVELQHLVDYTAARGLKGLETLTGIPGWVGAAVYGNAGAYGHSMMERVHQVRFFDGDQVCTFSNSQCEFSYRESVFKWRKDWVIFSVDLVMDKAPSDELQHTAAGILKVRNEKYPPTMKCAGSIFKNLLLRDLPSTARDAVPPAVVREGKVPSAWFLEQVGAKGMQAGGIHVADYHANLIYNAGDGTAAELVRLIEILKARVYERFTLRLEEEVQYVGF